MVDFISDRQLAELTARDGALHAGKASWRAIVVPSCEVMPLRTLEKICVLAEGGATVVLAGNLPSSAAGLAGIGQDRDAFQTALQKLETLIASGRATAGFSAALPSVPPETITVSGQGSFIRRKYDDGVAYFVVNNDFESFDGPWGFRARGKSVALFNPQTGQSGLAEWQADGLGTGVRLQIGEGQSCIVRFYDHAVAGPKYPYAAATSDSLGLITGPWKLTFLSGGPALPAPVELPELTYWTDLDSEDAKNFSGVARYAAEFDRPAGEANAWLLSFRASESAEVRLNGQSLQTLIGPDDALMIPADKLRDHNTLEIDVANTMANRIADLDRRGVPWKKFYNVNFVPRRSENRGRNGLFDASKWSPRPSGLTGIVRLYPMMVAEPSARAASP